MTDFASNSTDVAPITTANIQAGFTACEGIDDTMPMTTSYINAVFKWVCEQIDSVIVLAGNALAAAQAINGVNVGVGVALFLQRSGDNLQFKTLVPEKGLTIIPTGTTVSIGQTLVCCYSELGFAGGAPSDVFVSSILIDDVSDPSNPEVYFWSCGGATYAGTTVVVPPAPSDPYGDGFTAIVETDCDGTTSGTIINTTSAFNYALTVTATIQVDELRVDGVIITPANYASFPVDPAEVVEVDVSGVDPNGGITSGSITLAYDNGGGQTGTAVNVPVSLLCVVAPPAPTAPADQNAPCVNLPTVINGFINAVTLTSTSNVTPSDYTVTPNVGLTEVSISGVGDTEIITITASNGNVAEDAVTVVTVGGCAQNFFYSSPNPVIPSTSSEDFVGDIQGWTTHIHGGFVAGCGWTVNGAILFRRTHSNGDPTEYTVELTGGGNWAGLLSITYTSSSGAATTIFGGTGNVRSISQAQYNLVAAHLEAVDGYTMEFICS